MLCAVQICLLVFSCLSSLCAFNLFTLNLTFVDRFPPPVSRRSGRRMSERTEDPTTNSTDRTEVGFVRFDRLSARTPTAADVAAATAAAATTTAASAVVAGGGGPRNDRMKAL